MGTITARRHLERMMLVSAVLVMSPAAATATTCPPGPANPQSALKGSGAVFVGRVTGIRDTAPEFVEVTFAIEKAWKGVTASTMTVVAWTPCSSIPRARRVLVYAGEDRPTPPAGGPQPIPRPRLHARPAFEVTGDIDALGPPTLTFQPSPATFKGTVTAIRDGYTVDVRPDGEQSIVAVKLEGLTFEGSPWSPVEGLAIFTMGKHVLVDPIVAVAGSGPMAADIYMIDIDAPPESRISLAWDLVASRAARWDRQGAPHDAVLPWLEEFARRRFGER